MFEVLQVNAFLLLTREIFMYMQESRVIALAPFTFPPYWARTLSLGREDIAELYEKVCQALDELTCLYNLVSSCNSINQTLLNAYNKEPRAIREVVDELNKISSPTDYGHTRWLNKARIFAASTKLALLNCFYITRQLINDSDSSKTVLITRDYVSVLENAKEQAEELKIHFDNFIAILSDNGESNQENIVTTPLSDIGYKDEKLENASQDNRLEQDSKVTLLTPYKLSSHTDLFSRYEVGVGNLRQILEERGWNKNNDEKDEKYSHYRNLLLLQGRLIENISFLKRGDNQQAERNSIIEQLNDICMKVLERSFHDLCDSPYSND
ncbi:MAG: hypothetical protein NW224_01090 [Leptolyngbyaceae cyanobacterium bins.302]|nr:hypothetical protein [Leptolyngbyaceae cyanobacterium bins.302]